MIQNRSIDSKGLIHLKVSEWLYEYVQLIYYVETLDSKILFYYVKFLASYLLSKINSNFVVGL